MNKKEFQDTLAKLQVAISMAKVKALEDPEPYLDSAYQEITRLHRCLEEVKYALSDYATTAWIEENTTIEPVEFVGESLVKVKNALAVISKYEKNEDR